MITGFWGKKIGMTQVYKDNKAIPVTVIDASNWVVTNIRKPERDGYMAIQIGCIKDRYVDKTFNNDWIKQPKKYFSLVREVRFDSDMPEVKVGSPVDFYSLLNDGDVVDVSGTSKGRGFAGVVKRHGFGGPPGSHGSKMGNKPGSIGCMRSQGRVFKGKRLPGHMGVDWKMLRKLKVVRVEPDKAVVFVKGSVPGNAGSFLYVRKV